MVEGDAHDLALAGRETIPLFEVYIALKTISYLLELPRILFNTR